MSYVFSIYQFLVLNLILDFFLTVSNMVEKHYLWIFVSISVNLTNFDKSSFIAMKLNYIIKDLYKKKSVENGVHGKDILLWEQAKEPRHITASGM